MGAPGAADYFLTTMRVRAAQRIASCGRITTKVAHIIRVSRMEGPPGETCSQRRQGGGGAPEAGG